MIPGVDWKRGGKVGLAAVIEVGDEIADSRWNGSLSMDSDMDFVRFCGREKAVAEEPEGHCVGCDPPEAVASGNLNICSPGRGDAIKPAVLLGLIGAAVAIGG